MNALSLQYEPTIRGIVVHNVILQIMGVLYISRLQYSNTCTAAGWTTGTMPAVTMLMRWRHVWIVLSHNCSAIKKQKSELSR